MFRRILVSSRNVISSNVSSSSSKCNKNKQILVRRSSNMKDYFPDKAMPKSRPNYEYENPGIIRETGEGDAFMEYASMSAVFIVCLTMCMIPMYKDNQTLDKWAIQEAKLRMQMKEDGEEIEWGRFYNDERIRAAWAPQEEED